MKWEFDDKSIIINGQEYPLDPTVWKCLLCIAEDKQEARHWALELYESVPDREDFDEITERWKDE